MPQIFDDLAPQQHSPGDSAETDTHQLQIPGRCQFGLIFCDRDFEASNVGQYINQKRGPLKNWIPDLPFNLLPTTH